MYVLQSAVEAFGTGATTARLLNFIWSETVTEVEPDGTIIGDAPAFVIYVSKTEGIVGGVPTEGIDQCGRQCAAPTPQRFFYGQVHHAAGLIMACEMPIWRLEEAIKLNFPTTSTVETVAEASVGIDERLAEVLAHKSRAVRTTETISVEIG